MTNKKRIGIFASIFIILCCIYVYIDWDIIKLKNGYTQPMIITYDQYDETPIPIKVPKHKLKNLNISITDLYYYPESQEIQYGLWYKKWYYRGKEVPWRVFDVSFVSDSGQVSNISGVATKDGLIDVFQIRANQKITLKQSKSLKMIITSVKQEGKTVTPIVKEEININLPQLTS
ncbi:hypothetical protein M3223_08110 [Paenibacillus pasadenensis]|uniref:hypothetical protein n=1 Tax=Paenibacillus pasadenensis TaxID=217090 RepID=UPI002041F195|nr:hypothetical protein [Paenibacillus pasadenensis]MCM3747317.1 hypothetical protein [Paenibacillus pasadenensis]